MKGGLENTVAFARNYLQPSVEKKAAGQYVTISQSAVNQPTRKTLNILGKRYKKTGAGFKMLTRKKKK